MSRLIHGNGRPDQLPTSENIEPGLYLLVIALNRTGLCRTRARCEGHWRRKAILVPDVALTGDLCFAERLDRLIVKTPLELPWYLDARFGVDHQLWWRLAVNRHALTAQDPIFLSSWLSWLGP